MDGAKSGVVLLISLVRNYMDFRHFILFPIMLTKQGKETETDVFSETRSPKPAESVKFPGFFPTFPQVLMLRKRVFILK